MSRRAWGAFAAVSVLWGLPYLFIKIADDGGMPPLVLAWSRVALGATVPLPIAVLSLRFEPTERVCGARLAGLLVGLAGVAALVGVDVSGHGGKLLGVGAVLIGACGYAVGPLILVGSWLSTRTSTQIRRPRVSSAA